MKQTTYIFSGYQSVRIIMLIQFAVLISISGFAQGQQRDRNEEVTIRGTYDPTIDQAYKISIKPETFSLTSKKPEFHFQSIDVDQPTQITLEPIEPATIRADRRTLTYNNFLKAGIGSWFSPYIDFQHSSTNNDATFNAGLYHLSSFRNIPDYSPSPESDTHLNIDWKKVSRTHIFSIGAMYGLKTNRYYGFKPDDYANITIDDNNLKQMFNLVKVDVGLESNYRREESKLNHEFKVSAYYFFDKHKSSESNAELEFDLHKAFSVTQLLNYQHLGLQGKLEYSGNKDSLQSMSDVLTQAMPYFKAKYGIINFIVGLKLAYLISDVSKFAFNPVIKVDVNVIPEGLTLYGGIEGGLVRNSLLKLSDQNPWIVSTIEARFQSNQFRYQHNQFDISGGIRGNIARQLGFNLQAGFLVFKDMPFFVNTTGYTSFVPAFPMNKFTVIYDKGNRLNFSGELTYQFGGNVKMWLKGEYNIYSLDSLEYAYHKPISLVSLGGSYLIKQKLNIWIEGFLCGKRYALDTSPQFSQLWTNYFELDSFFDLNLGVSYNINDTFSVWLSGTNLLNSNYQRYYNYPVQGFEIMGGIGIRF